MLYFLTIARDGYARTDDGYTYPRWVCAASADGAAPAFRYRNGGPRGFVRSSAMRRAPDWMDRAVAYVRFVGGLPLTELEDVVAWYKRHRVGAYPGAFSAA